jgi:hypothetical protein
MRVLAVGLFAFVTLAGGQTVDRTIGLTVLDRSGAPVKDLKTADFALTEGGEPRTIVNAALSPDPLSVVVVVDTTQPPNQLQQILDERDALKAFVRTLRSVDPQARIGLIVCAGPVLQTAAFETSPAELDRRIATLTPTYQVQSSVAEAVIEAARMVGATESLRRAIVVIDLDSIDPPGIRVEEAAAAVEKSRAAFWPISVRTSGLAASTRESLLNYLPPRTGTFRQTTIISRPLTEMLRRLAQVLASQYFVTYRRPAAAPVTAIVPSVTRGTKILMSPWMR